MSAALEIHADYPSNRQMLRPKQAVASNYTTADDIPSLRGKYAKHLDYPGAVTKSCMHCHQVRDATRQTYRDAGRPIPDELMFPNPLPSVIGFELDPRTRATISSVTPGTVAATAGLQPGDQIITLEHQPIISLADIQWALHHAPSSGELSMIVKRNGENRPIKIDLPTDWRRRADISWRVSSWPLRRMVTGGLLFETATDEQRRDARIDDNKLALAVKHVGQYGPHAAAKKAGFKKGDIVISYHGRDERMSPSQLLAYGAQNTKPGQTIPVVVVRNGVRKKLTLPMQK